MSERAIKSRTDAAPLDIQRVRADFPAMSLEVHGRPLVFLDSGASAQKPRVVLDTMRRVYESEYANVHRGAYYLSERSTALYEGARDKLRDFLNARDRKEIIFTRNATESINLVAYAWGRKNLKAGDEIVISAMEHHSNIVPWQMLRDEMGLTLKIAPVSDDGEFLLDAFKALLTDRTKLVAITHVSNVLGTITPVKEIVRLAHDAGAKVLLDGAQAAVHLPVDVQDIGCDFYAVTGHKLYGPTGIGVLYGKEAILDAMPPFMSGGDMIGSVSFEKTTWAPLPAKFEAGTPAIVQAIGLGAAVDYMTGLGREKIAAHEHDLLNYATQRLASIDGLKIYGTAPNKAAVISFTLGDIHAHDVSTIIDRAGVAIRAGHHCAEPLMERLGVAATARASFGVYNTREDADALVKALETVQEIFG
ncbi:MAG: SufS family cysteine desulfurase [Alphaproteobacteria bacterium]|nr:SufS family cysteine desulfurase [Alphaproteobacteria bacterium]